MRGIDDCSQETPMTTDVTPSVDELPRIISVDDHVMEPREL